MRGYIYIIGSIHTDKAGKRKLGLTIYPVHRMRQYDIGDCPGEGLEKRYQALFLTTATTKKELHNIEAKLHAHFRDRRLPRENGRTSEWFRVEIDEVVDFLKDQPEIIRQLTYDEVKDIQEKVRLPRKKDEKDEVKQEKEFMEEQDEILTQEDPLEIKDKFRQVYLGDLPFRSIQSELWDIFWNIASQQNESEILELYKGIVQWPTGVGKTIAILSLIVIANEFAKNQGRIFRGLLIAPKNDIFNTIIDKIEKLSEFGITVVKGHNSLLTIEEIPSSNSFLLTATHAILTRQEIMMNLPPMELIHYDEVHRIGGEIFFDLLKNRLQVWNTKYLTGTSATPKTANPEQHKKLEELFGNPINIIHKCDIEEAVANKWIATPRFHVSVAPKSKERLITLAKFSTFVKSRIEQKKSVNWNGGKAIVYLPTRNDVREVIGISKRLFPETWKTYTAVEDGDTTVDDDFIKDPADGIPRVLFACERYREGSDIQGLEMTCVFMGDTIASNIILQIIGRALRADYQGKEGWCCIFRPSDDGVTEDEVLDKILFEIMETLGRNDQMVSKSEIKRVVKLFIGDLKKEDSEREKTYTIEDTVDRIQAIYERRVFERGVPREKYNTVRQINKELELKSRIDYLESRNMRKVFIENPEFYFKENWTNWYDFLGVDTSKFPKTKTEWIRSCQEKGITSYQQYKFLNSFELPINPGEMYSDFTNWDKEFIVEDEHIW